MSAVFSLLSSPHQRVPLYHIYPATWTIRVYGQLYPSCTASTIPLDMTFGVGNGVRTRDLLNGNQILYQLSYTHIWYLHSQRRSSALVPHPTISILLDFIDEGTFLSILANGTNYGEWCALLDSNQ